MIRKPHDNESADCIRLLYMSGPNMFSYFMIAQPPEIYDYMHILYTKPDVQFSRENILVYEAHGKPAGLILTVPGKELHQMDRNIGKYVKEMIKVMGIKNVAKMTLRSRMQKYMDGLHQEDEYYVSNLAVFEEYRGKGYGVALLQKAEELAKEKGYRKLSIMVETPNHHAKRIYENYGFIGTEEIMLPAKYRKYGIEGVCKMVKDVK